MFSIVTVFLSSPALAFAPAVAEIEGASSQLFVTVENTSGSAFAGNRKLLVTSDAPTVYLEGEVLCGVNSHGFGDLTAVGAVFGDPSWFDATTLWNQAGASVQVMPAGIGMADTGFNFPYTFPTGESESLVSLGLFQPVFVVESALQQHVADGGTAENFLRLDRVIEVPLTFFLTATCSMHTNGDGYTDTVYDSTAVTAYILYKGDPDLLDPLQVAVQTPNTIQAPSPAPARRRRR